jgi:hypothetical protein
MNIKSIHFLPILEVMRPSDKLRNDILRSVSEIEKVPKSARPALFRACILRYFGYLPAETQEAIVLIFEKKWSEDVEHAGEWLSILGGIFFQDYDGSPLSASEWRELRDILSEGSGELDMDLLSYAMALVLEHKAL